ncbi:UNVERIFIED_CONTAM: putative sphingolipid transporter spinster2 [Sesamum radiatum]|uniref:Sphingolipid transporter spinster2 n=1 Tax=Sesamum radiatum TaxID=300843 RepID=A0AAW2RWU0_SESRA
MGNEKPEDPNPDLNPDPNQGPEPSSAAVPLETGRGNRKRMAVAPAAVATNPSWFTPERLLIIFCLINLINYIDRGAIASNGVNGSRKTCSKDGTCSSGSGIQGDFNMNNFEDGVLSSAFMVGLLVASPIFASSAKSFNPFRLIGVGLTVWTLAVALCGFSFNFWSIAVCRMLVGVGEASFISLAAPFIDDNAPVTQRTAWLGLFYMCIPTGVAVGYVYGGVISRFGWRWAFWVEAILMLPFAILGFVMKPLQLKGLTPAESKKALTTVDNGSEDQGGELSRRVEVANESSKPLGLTALTVFGKDMKVLLLEKVYVVNVLGYIAYNFVIGAYSYWGPKAGYNIYHMSNADYMFGGVTAVCGILGSLAGGFVLDRMTSTIPNAFKIKPVKVDFTCDNCLQSLIKGSSIIGNIGRRSILLCCLLLQKPIRFSSFFRYRRAAGICYSGPCKLCLSALCQASLRPLSMAISTVSIHIFGDVPSSPLVGLLQEFFLNSVDRYNEDNEHPATAVDKSNSTPLLAEKTA